MSTPLEDIEFLARSEHRVNALGALAAGPQNRDDLRAAIGASSPTVGRLLNEFDKRTWVERNGHRYELTPLGVFIADGFFDLVERFETEQSIRDVWQWLPNDLIDGIMDSLADAVVTKVGPDDPFAAENRCASFLRRTSSLRGFDAVVSSPHSFGILSQRLLDGLVAEFILTPTVTEKLQKSYPRMNEVVRESEHFTLWLNEDLPRVRLMIFDNRVGIGGYDPGTGILAVYIDTDDSALREWAESVLEENRDKAIPATAERNTA